MTKTAVIYARVSTSNQTPENQLIELRSAAQRMGWKIAQEIVDAGVSGSKGREDRQGFDQLFRKIQRREIDVVMTWSIDRLGRSLQHLVSLMQDIQQSGVDLYVHQQAINTATPAGRMTFNIFSALGEYERDLIKQRVAAGISRARAQGRKLGRPTNVTDQTATKVHELRSNGRSIQHIAAELRIGVGTVRKFLNAAK